MNLQRIRAVVGRNLILNYRGFDPLTDIFYWPLFDIIVWGYTGRLMQSAGGESTTMIWLTGLIIWHGCVRANLDVCLSFLSELWSRNVVNLFATPLELSEWMVASMILGLIDGVITLFYGAALIALFYGVHILSLGWLLVPLFFLLLMSGWSIGFFSGGWLVYGGQSKQKIVWVLAWFFLPFSAVFYPLSLLPSWVATIARAFPMAYAYEGLRDYMLSGAFPGKYLIASFLLNCFYLTLSMLFFKTMYNKSRVKGLARLESE
jgi:ABC-2 type transport system permease protein